MSIESVVPSNHLILCRPLLLLASIFPSIRDFSNESALRIRWPKYWRFSFTISPSNEHLGLISFRMDWVDLLAVQGTLKSLLQHHSSKASILRCSALSLYKNESNDFYLLMTLIQNFCLVSHIHLSVASIHGYLMTLTIYFTKINYTSAFREMLFSHPHQVFMYFDLQKKKKKRMLFKNTRNTNFHFWLIRRKTVAALCWNLSIPHYKSLENF